MERQRLIPVTEERAIQRSTVPGLLEAFRDAFQHPYKVEMLLYRRGESTFTVERLVPESAQPGKEGGDDGMEQFLTPFQMIRQHAELEIQEPYDVLLEALGRAVQSLTTRGFKLTMFVCLDKALVRGMGRDLRIEDIWQVPLHEDPDATENGVFVVGSKSGPNIRDIETAVMCRIEGVV
jgi:hypothetical protein